MSGELPSVAAPKVKIRKRSRQGCGNCKLRGVKCDEAKPGCQRCVSYGAICTYDRNNHDLQLSVERAINIRQEKCLPYWLSENEHLLSKFRSSTALTCAAGKRLDEYQNEAIRLACSNSSVLHAILALTLMHDRYQANGSKTKLSKPEAYHLHQATTSFRNQLSRPLQEWEQAANRIVSALLGTMVFCHLEAETPEDSWPLRSPSNLDLDWLKMSDGKRVVWKTPASDTVPTSSPSNQSAASDYTEDLLYNRLPTSENEDLPQDFISLYGLDADMASGNPYYSAALAFLQNSAAASHSITIILNFWTFVAQMRPDFRTLLESKDARALLLLAFWYSRLCNLGVWWFTRRTTLEGRSICLYLERHCPHESKLQELLQIPKMSLYQGDI